MIIGVGIDLVQIERMERAFDRFGEAFLQRVFCPGEISWCKKKQNPYPCFAARFAAKEAFVKALGTGFSGGITLKDIWIERLDTGAPVLRFSNRAKQMMEELGSSRVHVSLTHEMDVAAAVVVMEK